MDASDVPDAVAEAHRLHWGRILATTLRYTRDLDIAEESTADAFELALRDWARSGVPESVEAWLITAARRRAIDRLRREATLREKLRMFEDEAADVTVLPDQPLDDELHLALLAADPSLTEQTRVALMLRLTCGVSTEAVAAAFLTSVSAMAARLTRAKQAVGKSPHLLDLPTGDELASRRDAVRRAAYLTYTLGHTAGDGDELRRTDFVAHARHLATVLAGPRPAGEDAGLLALILLSEARAGTRVVDGDQVLLVDADRALWSKPLIARGLELVDAAMRVPAPGSYAVQSAISAEHTIAASFADVDWSRVIDLYGALLALDPNPTYAIGRAVAISYGLSPMAGLADLNELAAIETLQRYPYLHAAQADCLRRLGRSREAADAYRRAADLSRNDAERAFFADKSETSR